jgi:NAD-dependent deacetylase
MQAGIETLDAAAALLSEARRITVLTGAGVSAESGVPTFRGVAGLWKQRRPEELATPEAFAADPREVWEFYRWRRELVRPLEPNPGHLTLAAWQERFETLHLVTQNVDGLHGAAGSRDVIHLHGSLWRTRCLECGVEEERRDDLGDPESGQPVCPRCPRCEGLLRPAVVWFGEALPPESLQRALEVSRDCDAFLCIGTSSLVQPAASLPLLALQAGSPVVEINPEPTPLSELATMCLRGPSGEMLPALEARLP